MDGSWIQLKLSTLHLSVRIKMSHDPAFLVSSEMVPKERVLDKEEQGLIPKRVLLFGACYITNNILWVSIWSNQCFHSPLLAGRSTQPAFPQLFLRECLKMATFNSLQNWGAYSHKITRLSARQAKGMKLCYSGGMSILKSFRVSPKFLPQLARGKALSLPGVSQSCTHFTNSSHRKDWQGALPHKTAQRFL